METKYKSMPYYDMDLYVDVFRSGMSLKAYTYREFKIFGLDTV